MNNVSPSSAAVARGIAIGLAVGTLLWLGLLLHGAADLHLKGSGTSAVRFGPLTLHRLSLSKDDGTVRAGITTEPGLLVFAASCTAIGAAGGFMRTARHNK